jgi:hypothetical protein
MTTSKISIPIREVASSTDGMVELADAAVTAALSQIEAVHTARAAASDREIKRLTASRTERANRIELLKSRLTSDLEVAGEAKLAARRAAQDHPEIGPRSWALYGLVFHGGDKPATNYRLSLSDQRTGKQLGESFVDEQGSFALKIDVGPQRGEDDSELSEGRPAKLALYDPDGRLEYSTDQGLEILAGNVEYREILLKAPAGTDKPRKKTTAKKTSRKKTASKKPSTKKKKKR